MGHRRSPHDRTGTSITTPRATQVADILRAGIESGVICARRQAAVLSRAARRASLGAEHGPGCDPAAAAEGLVDIRPASGAFVRDGNGTGADCPGRAGEPPGRLAPQQARPGRGRDHGVRATRPDRGRGSGPVTTLLRSPGRHSYRSLIGCFRPYLRSATASAITTKRQCNRSASAMQSACASVLD